MRINSVDFPDSVFKAQQDGSLVVFAGAGVSIPPPSNFPDFKLLAEQVAAGVLTRERDEPVDRFLGKLKDKGVEVHEKVRRILSDRKSKPSAFHLELLRLFEEPNKLRLVTTNFDSHFTSAGMKRFPTPDSFEIYSAPTLPLGSSFSGIVYLHGSVEKPAERLVLTDSDFGMAYLTQAWATRFLQQLFDHYLVLFIGYSHNDTVLDYLARGLPPKSKGPGRFALTPELTEAHWKRLGITPITYPEGAIGARHSALGPALKGWVDRVRASVLDHEERIKAIVERPVSLDPEELDYIEGVCKDATLAQFFARHCRTSDWLRWIEGKGLLTNLFKQSVPPTGIDQLLARWFAQWFTCQHSDDALAVLQRQGGFIAPVLWDQIALSFHQLRPDHEAVAKWVPLLVNAQPHHGSREDLLAYRLCTCEFPRDEQTILILFEHLTRLRMRLRKRFSLIEEEDEKAEPEVFVEGSEYWLRDAWTRLLEPNLELLADRLLITLTSNIQQVYWTMRSFGKVRSEWDPISGPRAEIESSGFGGHEHTGVVIDMARDVLKWIISHRSKTSDSIINAWFSSGYRLLERLAVFGVAESNHWNADQKLYWLIENNLIHRYGFKPEVFLVLKRAYAPASEPVRAALLERTLKGSDNLERQIKEYAIFNLLFWLTQNAPDCPMTRQQFAEFSADHPDFTPQEHPNLDWWIGGVGWTGPKSPLTLGEIIATSPEKLIEELANAKVDDFAATTNRRGLLNEISKAVAGNFEWSVQHAKSLNEKKLWEPDLWRALVTGWKNVDLTEEQWQQVLDILRDSQPILGSLTYEASELLEKGIKKTTHRIPLAHLALSVGLSEMLWNLLVAAPDDRRGEEAKDWLLLAINDSAGTLLTFRLHTLSRLREAAGENWTKIPPEEKSFLESVLAGTSYAASLGRVLIASQLYFLFNLDPAWTIEKVVPLFNLAENELRALQAWHGFLVWGRWTEDLLPHLLPRFEQAFQHLHLKFGKEQRESFCNFLAGIACYGSIDPIENGWLNRFLQKVTPEERIMWSSSMSGTLKSMKDPLPENAWRKWVSTYWQNRIDGIPMPLEVGEISEMIEWALAFKVSFPEIAENIYRSPAPKREHEYFYDELSKAEILKLHPKAAATLVLYLLKIGFSPIYWFDPLVKIIQDLKSFEDAKQVLREICGELAKLGYPEAGNLKNSI